MKYILTSEEEFSGEIIFEYNLKGFLKCVEISSAKHMRLDFFNWLWRNLPLSIRELEGYKVDAQKMITITEAPEDLSFDRFWKEYGNKVGKKTMTENAWKKLSQADKIKALSYIPKLRTKKTIDGTQMPYPSTYLNQRYWEV